MRSRAPGRRQPRPAAASDEINASHLRRSIGTSPPHEPRIPRTVERGAPQRPDAPRMVRGVSVECRQWVESCRSPGREKSQLDIDFPGGLSATGKSNRRRTEINMCRMIDSFALPRGAIGRSPPLTIHTSRSARELLSGSEQTVGARISAA
jgi:hypothetical protein